MITFSKIKDFIEYIPNCIICQKPMVLGAEITSVKRKTLTCVKTKIIDDIMVSKKPEFEFVININTNQIVNMTADIFLSHYIKYCATCKFTVEAYAEKLSNKIDKIAAPTVLSFENLCYTTKKNKHVKLAKYYYNINSCSQHIVVDKKIISIPIIDLSQIKNLKHLDKRIATLMVLS